MVSIWGRARPFHLASGLVSADDRDRALQRVHRL